MLTSWEEQKLMQVWLDIAEQLLNAGAEISRVEDTIHLIRNIRKENAKKWFT